MEFFSHEKVIKAFDRYVHQLTIMFKAKEITRDDLLNLYIKTVPKRNNGQNYFNYTGLEYGTQKFFESIMQLKHKTHGVVKNMVSNKPSNYEEFFIKELIYALSRAMSIGQLDESYAFAQLDPDKKRSSSSLMR